MDSKKMPATLVAAHARCMASDYEHWGLVLVREEPPILGVYPHGTVDADHPSHVFDLSVADSQAIACEIETWNRGPQGPGMTPTLDRYRKEWDEIAAQ